MFEGMNVMGHTGTRMRGRIAAFVATLVCALVLMAPSDACALTTDKATARPNEDGGSSVIGGLNTRLTWEGTVDAEEEVSKITLALPDGGSFDGSTTKVTALEGLNRADVEIDGEPKAQGNTLTVSFVEPVGEGLLLRLEV